MYLHKLLAVSPILHALAAAAATGAGPAADHGAGVTTGDSSVAERYMVDPDHTPPDYSDPMAERKGICLFESQECVIGETVLPCIHNEHKSRQCHKTGETCWALGLPPFDSALCGGRRPMRKPGMYPYGKPKPQTTSVVNRGTTTFERYYPTTGPNSTKISVSFQTWPNSGPVHTKAAVQERDSANTAILPTPEEAARLEQERRERVALLRSNGMNTTMAIEECVEKEMIRYSEEQQASDIPDRLPIRIAEAMVRDNCAWDINHPKTTHSAAPTQKTNSPATGKSGINQVLEKSGTLKKHKTHLPRDPESARHRHGRHFKTTAAIEKCVREEMDRQSEEAGRRPMNLTPLWEAEADARMDCRKKLEHPTSTHSTQPSQSTGDVKPYFYRFGKGPFVPATEVKPTKETDSPLPEEYFGRGPEMPLPESDIRERHEPDKYRHGKYGKFRSTPQIEECVRKGVEQALNDEKEFAWSPRMHVKSTAAYQREICRELLDPAHQAPVAEPVVIDSRPDEIHVKRNATTAAKSKSKDKSKDKDKDKSKDKGKGKDKSKPKPKSRAKKLKEKELARLAAKKADAQRKAEKARIAALEKATHDRSHADMNKWEDAQLHDAKKLKKTTHPREACIDQYIAAQLGNPERAPYINRENIDVVRKNARKHCKNYLQGFGWDKGEKIPPGAYYDGRPKVAMPGPVTEGKGVKEGDVGTQMPK